MSPLPKRVALLGGSAIIAIAASTVVTLLPQLGRWIGQPLIERDYFLGLWWAVLLGLSIFLWPVSASDRRALILLWLAKCVVTLGLMLLYEWNYSLDAYSYFAGANSLSGPVLKLFAIGSGAENVTAVASLVAAAVPNSYHALKVSFAMLGLVGMYCYYQAAVLFVGREDQRILFLIGLFPSIIFWSSILGKDPLQFLGISLYVFGVVGWSRTRRWRYVGAIALGIFVSASMRIWSGPILLVPLVVFLFQRGTGIRRRLVFAALAATALVAAWSAFADHFRVQSAADLISTAGDLSGGWEGGSQTLAGVSSFTDVGSLLRFAPIGMFTALFRPLPGEVLNVFGLIAGLENALLLFLALRAIRNSSSASVADPLVQWAILLIFTWALAYGFVAYNLGAVVRFKLQILPLMLLLSLHLGRRPVRLAQQ